MSLSSAEMNSEQSLKVQTVGAVVWPRQKPHVIRGFDWAMGLESDGLRQPNETAHWFLNYRKDEHWLGHFLTKKIVSYEIICLKISTQT